MHTASLLRETPYGLTGKMNNSSAQEKKENEGSQRSSIATSILSAFGSLVGTNNSSAKSKQEITKTVN